MFKIIEIVAVLRLKNRLATGSLAFGNGQTWAHFNLVHHLFEVPADCPENDTLGNFHMANQADCHAYGKYFGRQNMFAGLPFSLFLGSSWGCCRPLFLLRSNSRNPNSKQRNFFVYNLGSPLLTCTRDCLIDLRRLAFKKKSLLF